MNNKTVAHEWANQTRQSRTGSNFYFEGPALYSYGSRFRVGLIGHTAAGVCALVNSASYSNSTSKHQSMARSAASHLVQFSVPNVGANVDDIAGNYAYYVAQIEEAQSALMRARTATEAREYALRAVVKEAVQFSEYFPLSSGTASKETISARRKIRAIGAAMAAGALISDKDRAIITKKIEAKRAIADKYGPALVTECPPCPGPNPATEPALNMEAAEEIIDGVKRDLKGQCDSKASAVLELIEDVQLSYGTGEPPADLLEACAAEVERMGGWGAAAARALRRQDPKQPDKVDKGEAIPWLWLEDGEGRADDDNRGGGADGVTLVRDYNNGGPAVFIPEAMKQAKEMRTALEKVMGLLDAHYPEFAFRFPKESISLRAVIAKGQAK